MRRYIIAYGAAALVFVAMDACWLTFMGPHLYKAELPGLLTDKPALVPAILFYLIYLAGVFWFAVRPALVSRRWATAAANGALLALCAYATYDLTNQATLRIWSTKVTVFDLVWGVVVTVAAASAGLFAARWIEKR